MAGVGHSELYFGQIFENKTKISKHMLQMKN